MMPESTARWMWQSYRWSLPEAVMLGRFVERLERVLTQAGLPPVPMADDRIDDDRPLPDLLIEQLQAQPMTSAQLWEAVGRVSSRHAVTCRLGDLKKQGTVRLVRAAAPPFGPPKWELTGVPRQALK